MPVSRKRRKAKKGKKNKVHSLSHWNAHSATQREVENRMRKRALESDLNVSFESGLHKHSVSALVIEFGQDIIDMCYTKDDYLKFIPFIVVCWNLGNFNNEQRDKIDLKMLKIMDQVQIEEMMEFLIERKRSHYNEYKYLITDYEIIFEEGNPRLMVTSANLND